MLVHTGCTGLRDPGCTGSRGTWSTGSRDTDCTGSRVTGCTGSRVIGCACSRVACCSGSRVTCWTRLRDTDCTGSRFTGCTGSRATGCTYSRAYNLHSGLIPFFSAIKIHSSFYISLSLMWLWSSHKVKEFTTLTYENKSFTRYWFGIWVIHKDLAQYTAVKLRWMYWKTWKGCCVWIIFCFNLLKNLSLVTKY